jgi:hypothetical protein
VVPRYLVKLYLSGQSRILRSAIRISLSEFRSTELHPAHHRSLHYTQPSEPSLLPLLKSDYGAVTNL